MRMVLKGEAAAMVTVTVRLWKCMDESEVLGMMR